MLKFELQGRKVSENEMVWGSSQAWRRMLWPDDTPSPYMRQEEVRAQVDAEAQPTRVPYQVAARNSS